MKQNWTAQRPATPEDDHFFRVEVTVAAMIGTPDNRALGDNLVDATFGFSMSMSRPPKGASDAEINEVLSRHISPVVAAIVTTLTVQLGFAFLGTIDEPMTEHSSPTGEFGQSHPVSVRVSMPTAEGRA